MTTNTVRKTPRVRKVSPTERRKAERIIKATGAYPASLRRAVRRALGNDPARLRELFARIEDVDRHAEEYGKGLHAFASGAYTAALRSYNPEAIDLARRVAKLWEAERGRPGEGAYHLMRYVDRVTDSHRDGLTPNPDAEFFLPVFLAAVRDIGTRDPDYIALKNLVEQAEAGASLAAMHDGKNCACG